MIRTVYMLIHVNKMYEVRPASAIPRGHAGFEADR